MIVTGVDVILDGVPDDLQRQHFGFGASVQYHALQQCLSVTSRCRT